MAAALEPRRNPDDAWVSKGALQLQLYSECPPGISVPRPPKNRISPIICVRPLLCSSGPWPCNGHNECWLEVILHPSAYSHAPPPLPSIIYSAPHSSPLP